MKWRITDNAKHTIVELGQDTTPNSIQCIQVQDKLLQVAHDNERLVMYVTDDHGVESNFRFTGRHCRKDDEGWDVQVSFKHNKSIKTARGTAQVYAPGLEAREAAQKNQTKIVKSPITGKVLKVLAENGSAVTKDSPILIIEAMKMENRITASSEGILDGPHVNPGDNVSVGQLLFKVTPENS